MKAFPKSYSQYPTNDGMDLRDYFAAKALPVIMKYIQKQLSMTKDFEGYDTESSAQVMAHDAYKVADAMMEVRNERSS